MVKSTLTCLFLDFLENLLLWSQVWLLRPSRLVSSAPSLTLVTISNWLVVVTTMLLPSTPRWWRYRSRFLLVLVSVPFIPVLDASFEVWFKKASSGMWKFHASMISGFPVGSRGYWGHLWPRSSVCMYHSRSHSCKMVSGEGRTCQGPSWQHQHGSYPVSPRIQTWWWQVCHPHYWLPCSPEQGSPENPPLVSLWRAQNMTHH